MSWLLLLLRSMHWNLRLMRLWLQRRWRTLLLLLLLHRDLLLWSLSR